MVLAPAIRTACLLIWARFFDGKANASFIGIKSLFQSKLLFFAGQDLQA